MGIPTGPQQGGNTGRGGLPTGRVPGSQQPGQQRGTSPQGGTQRPAQPRRESGLPGLGEDQPRQPQQRPAGAPAPRQAPPRQSPAQAPRQQPSRQPVREQPQALPDAADEQFDDPFESFDGENEDLFSDVPRGYQDESSSDNSYDEDDPFSSTDPDEEEEEDAFEPEPEPEPQRPAKRQKPEPAAKPRRFQGNSRAPQRSKSADEEYSEEFVDRKSLKLKPFGKDSKKRARVGDFDQRKNLEGQRRIYRGVFIAAVLAVVSFGFYQTFWPQQTLSVAEVQNIAALQSGETGFPTTKGEGFAISFIDSLLTVDPADENSAKRSAALSYFYGTDGGNDQAFSDAMATVGSVRQQVVYGPVALDSTALTANAASYEVGVLLSTSDKSTDTQDPEAEASSLRWVAFNVNVYYDEKNDSFAIAPNSPSLMPAPSVKAPSAVPAGEPLGESIDDYPESIKATVTGFLDGYRQSSKGNIDKILQYIGTDADESLRDGLNGRYQFATPDDPETSIEMQVFRPGDSNSELKVLLKVDWQIPLSGESSVTLPSHYVLTLDSQGGGDYKVTKFAPYYWTEATSTDG